MADHLLNGVKFNKVLAVARVAIEHAFGVLKSRFPSLDRIPLYFSKLGDHSKFVQWILICIILHNFLQFMEDSEDYWIEESLLELKETESQAVMSDWLDGERDAGEAQDTISGRALRDQLRFDFQLT
jgi:hypothetical protein